VDEITAIREKTDRVDIKGKAILFEKTLYCKVPDDMTEEVAMAVLDVAGAPAQAEKLVHQGDAVLILGAAGKSGLLCAYEARKKVGPQGLVVGLVRNPQKAQKLIEMEFCDKVIYADAQNPLEVLEKALEANDGNEYDISINCLNTPNCEMSCILPVKDLGIVYFFSMATSFTRAALGAEGIAKDVTMIIGNGYSTGHAVKALNVLRESPQLKEYFVHNYVKH
jgi:L-erythro-3,5-diaminohexanoate dehydrogenase